MRMMWSRQVDELTLKCLISVHRHRSELNMKNNFGSFWEPTSRSSFEFNKGLLRFLKQFSRD